MKEIITTCFVLAYSMGSMMAEGAAIAKTENCSKKSEVKISGWNCTCETMADLVSAVKEYGYSMHYNMRVGEYEWTVYIDGYFNNYEVRV